MTPMRRSAALCIALLACSGAPPSEPAPPVQAVKTTPTVTPPPPRSSGKVILPDAPPDFPDPASSEELVARQPSLASLSDLHRNIVREVANSVPAPCEPCAGASLGRCVADGPSDPVACAITPRLLARVALLATQGEAPSRIREAVLYPDYWFELPQDRRPWASPAGAVRVEVWVEPAGPFLTPAVLALAKLPQDRVSIVMRGLVDPERGASRALIAGAMAAEGQGMGLTYLQAVEAWRADTRDAVRRGEATFDAGAAAAIAHTLRDQGLDITAWQAASQSKATQGQIDSDQKLAASLGIRSAPSWFVQGFRLRGAQSDIALGRLIALEEQAMVWERDARALLKAP